MRLIDVEPIIKNLSAMKTQLGYDAIEIDGMIKALREAEEVTNSDSLNDPLTLEQLRKIDGEPVWVIFYAAYGETVGMWALVSVDEYTKEVFLTNRLGGRSEYKEVAVHIEAIYRRKPEEGMT